MKNRELVFGVAILSLLPFMSACSKSDDHIAVSADGVRIAYADLGKGSPAIVFVHGWTNNKSIWDRQMSHFSGKYRAVAVDLAGSGGSSDNRGQWTMAAFAEDVVAVIRKLGLKKAVLVGFSMGAPVILETAKRVPERLVGLVIVDDLQDIERKYPPEVVAQYEAAMLDVVRNPTLEKLVTFGFFKKDPEASFQKVLAMLKGGSTTGWEASFRDIFRWVNEDCLGSVQGLRVPVVSINSDIEPTNVEAFRKYVPAYKARIITGVGHVLMWDAPEEFNRLLEESIQDFVSGAK